MLLQKIQRGTKTNYIHLPRVFANYYGWRPGAYVYIQQLAPNELRLTLIGTTPDEAARNLADLLRPHQPPDDPTAGQHRRPADSGPSGQHGPGGTTPADSGTP